MNATLLYIVASHTQAINTPFTAVYVDTSWFRGCAERALHEAFLPLIKLWGSQPTIRASSQPIAYLSCITTTGMRAADGLLSVFSSVHSLHTTRVHGPCLRPVNTGCRWWICMKCKLGWVVCTVYRALDAESKSSVKKNPTCTDYTSQIKRVNTCTRVFKYPVIRKISRTCTR